MTVATRFYNWQTSSLRPAVAPYNVCAPGLDALLKYLTANWGGRSVGCFANRPVRGGKSPSSHAYGAALDWRYSNPGPGRATVLEVVIPFLISNSEEIGLQAIHDYVGCRIWRANRSGDSNGGWKKQTPSGDMGNPGSLWLHLEVLQSRWGDARPVREKLGLPAPAPTPVAPTFDPAVGRFGDWPSRPNKPRLRSSAAGDAVRYLQGVLKKAGLSISVDGRFGPVTEERVRAFQKSHGLVVDGIVGNQTWATVDTVAHR